MSEERTVRDVRDHWEDSGALGPVGRTIAELGIDLVQTVDGVRTRAALTDDDLAVLDRLRACAPLDATSEVSSGVGHVFASPVELLDYLRDGEQ